VGFEFELGWESWQTNAEPEVGQNEQAALAIPQGHKNLWTNHLHRLKKKKVLIDETGFTLQAEDYPNQDEISSVEVVTDPFSETDQGQQEAATAADGIMAFGNRLLSKRGAGQGAAGLVPLGEFGTPQIQHGWILPSDDDVEADPQTTVGVALGQVPELMKDLSAPSGVAESNQEAGARQEGRLALSARFMQPFLGQAESKAATALPQFAQHYNTNLKPDEQPDWQPSSQAKGLLAMLTSYIDRAKGFTATYPKAKFPLLARTDFHRLYQMLPVKEQEILNGPPLIDLVKRSTGLNDMEMDQQLFTAGVAHVNVRQLTRREWIANLPAVDLLTEASFPDADPQRANAKALESLGSYGDKADPVSTGQEGETEAGGIFEIRGVKKVKLNAPALKDFVTKTFNYIRALNRRQNQKYGHRKKFLGIF
jgi:hypothetical protein